MRTLKRPVVAMVAMWVLVVSAVGIITYLVVDHAARGVGTTAAVGALGALPPDATSTGSVPTPTTPSAPEPSETASPDDVTPAPTRTPSPTRSTSTGGSTSSGGSTSTSTSTTTRPAPTRTTSTAAPSRTASFATVGGTVVATCQSSAIRLDSITVRDGWRFEKDVSSSRIEVHFKSGEQEVELSIGCVGGVPTRLSGDRSGSDG